MTKNENQFRIAEECDPHPNIRFETLFSTVNDVTSKFNGYDDQDSRIECRYLDCSEFNSILPTSNTLSFFHLNINSLYKHFDTFSTLLNDLKHNFKIIAITETRITESSKTTHNFDIPGYSSISNETESSAGGTAIYINNTIKFKPRIDLSNSMYSSRQLESTFIEIALPRKTNVIVGCIYKHPHFSTSEFNTRFLAPLLHSINKESKDIVLLGDFNINLLNHNENSEVSDFVDILNSHLLILTINIPTRITNTSKTLIDNILISPSFTGYSGNLTVGISDHLPQFFICQKENDDIEQSNNTFKDWKQFDNEKFIHDFRNADWKETLQLHKNDPDFSFDSFYEKITTLIDKRVPTKTLTKKQILSKSKPWITTAIKKSIAKRDQIYKRFIKSKDQSEIKEHIFRQYKVYHNEIVKLNC